MFKYWIRGFLNLAKLIIGLAIYLVFKRTPAFAYQAMVGLFCFTKGYSNDVLSKIISYFKRPYSLYEPNGILGTMTEARRSRVSSKLNNQGYYIFEEHLPAKLCDQLLQFRLHSNVICAINEVFKWIL